MLATVPIVLISLCAVILIVGFAALMNIALKKQNDRTLPV